MDKKDVKKGFQEAQKEMKEDQIKHVKELAKRTLKKQEIITRERDDANKKLAILKKDIQDLKEGRLDRIEERQKKDPLALKTSVAKIEKVPEDKVKEIHHHHYGDRWYWPYHITWLAQPPYYDSMGSIVTTTDATGGLTLETSGIAATFTLNCSVAKDFTAGAYAMENGTTSYIT